MKKYVYYVLLLIVLGNGVSCSSGYDDSFWEEIMDIPGGNGMGNGNGLVSDDGDIPTFDATISEWNGEMAEDAHLDVVGTDKDFYYELNTFTNRVTITYNGSTATIEQNNDKILCHTSGAYVTVDLLTNSVSNTEIVIKGKSEDGGLKVYGENKFKLLMDGVELTSKRGPAINSQCKKRMYVHLNQGTTNQLTDVASYSDDTYYLDSSADEDRKGCFFSEGNLIFSGTGVLVVTGKYKHGIVTDGYFWMRPGVSLVVTEAAKNAIHVKGDDDDNIGVYIGGGLIYTHVSSIAGKGIKTDLHVEVAGGKLLLNTSGDSEYDADENDTSSAAGIKTDGDVRISGGTLILKSTGTGGKGLNVDGNLFISGGEIIAATAGGKYTYSSSLTSSPKGVKADGDITISGGKLNISVTGKSDGSEGLESKATLTVSGGEVYVYAYDDAINAASAINVTGGKVYAYARNNDGIDSNGTMTVSGGLVIGVGTSSPEGGIDIDNSSRFKINGGTVIGLGGTLQSSPSTSSTQRSVVYNGISGSKGTKVCVLNHSGSSILTFELPRTVSGANFFFSTADIVAGDYMVSTGGTLSGYTENWNGWFTGGTWTGGSQLGSFTSNSIVTTVGTFGGMGGGPGKF